MKISAIISPVFQRRLKQSEEAEYFDVLKAGKKALTGKESNNILIVPAPSLPQNPSNNTGVGILGSEESTNFFNFAKKYWGINSVELLPIGQFHEHRRVYPCYSGTSMDFGNHVINVKDYLSDEEFRKIVKNNKISDKINFKNVVDSNCAQEKALKNLYQNIPDKLNAGFQHFKSENYERLLPKGLYKSLLEIYGTHRYKEWSELDSNLFDEKIVSKEMRDKRINGLIKNKFETIDFYMFKQFLAEESFKKAKSEINKNGLKLIGDMPCGFAYEEVWAHPGAFLKDTTIGWGLPALDLGTKEAEEILRKKVNFYAKHYDGIRVDASWTYVSPNQKNIITGNITKKDWGDKILNIIDDEVLKVKGKNYDLKNIIHEFAASNEDFSVYNQDSIKPFLENRVKIYTSEHLSDSWGSSDAFQKRGWKLDEFVIGISNHDTKSINPTDSQAEVLSGILKIPKNKLLKTKEFIKAKFAEPMSAKNTMFFFTHALGIKSSYKESKTDKYTVKIPYNYEDIYHQSLQSGEGYNPMDGLEKQFKAKGLDKKNPELFKKIVKFRKILEQVENRNNKMLVFGICALSSAILASILIYQRSQRN